MGRTKEIESRAQEEQRKEKIKALIRKCLPEKQKLGYIKEEAVLVLDMACLFISVLLFGMAVASLHEESREQSLRLISLLQPQIEEMLAHLKEVSNGYLVEERVVSVFVTLFATSSYYFFDKILEKFDYEGW